MTADLKEASHIAAIRVVGWRIANDVQSQWGSIHNELGRLAYEPELLVEFFGRVFSAWEICAHAAVLNGLMPPHSLGSLIGDDAAARSPLPGAQGPTMEASGFGSLFSSDKIASALGLGAENGLGGAISKWLKESRTGGGILTSPLGQGLTSIAAGASVGYSSQSPLMGGISGALAGAMSGNPYLAVAGGIAGIAGGACGHKPSRKKDRDHERRQRHLRFA